MTPQDPQPLPRSLPLATEHHAAPPVYHWYHKMSAVLFIAFCVEIGLALLIYPWTDLWNLNYFSVAIPAWSGYWDNVFLKGAVSGLGAVNLYVSFTEIFRLRRFARR